MIFDQMIPQVTHVGRTLVGQDCFLRLPPVTHDFFQAQLLDETSFSATIGRASSGATQMIPHSPLAYAQPPANRTVALAFFLQHAKCHDLVLRQLRQGSAPRLLTIQNGPA